MSQDFDKSDLMVTFDLNIDIKIAYTDLTSQRRTTIQKKTLAKDDQKKRILNQS